MTYQEIMIERAVERLVWRFALVVSITLHTVVLALAGVI